MKILITGGAGFIGSNFILNHIADHEILNYDKLTYAGNLLNLDSCLKDSRHTFIKGDICQTDKLLKIFKDFEPSLIVNFAAESHVDRSIDSPHTFFETNVIGTLGLFEACRKYFKTLSSAKKKRFRVLQISSDEVYGSLGDEGFFVETTAYDPRSPYSASKASSDHLVRSYFHTFNIPVKLSNCSNNYGSHQFPEKLIPLIINNISHRKELPVYGKGDNVRDWLWVEDHARAIDLIFHEGKIGETYNIGGCNEWKNIDLVHLICDILDEKLNRKASSSRELIKFVKDRAGHDLRYAIDASKIKDELGWEPSVTFNEGLELTIDWYLNNKEWLNHVTSGTYLEYYSKQYL